MNDRVWCTFRTCRFCGVHRGQQHEVSCNWTDVHNPFPDVLYGDDEDWFNTDWHPEGPHTWERT